MRATPLTLIKHLAVLVCVLGTSVSASAQFRRAPRDRIDAGTNITVRTTETIEADESNGAVYRAVVEQNVNDQSGRVAIPRGSQADLMVRSLSDQEMALDLSAVTVNGQRYTLTTDTSNLAAERKEGIGTNKRTAKYVGGGALLGAIVGAIAGGGKGAAIGAGAGAAAGAGAQVLTRGRSVQVPAESVLTFRLAQPLEMVASSASSRYRPDEYGLSSAAFIERDAYNNISWAAPVPAQLFVQIDGRAPQLFADGESGSEPADWMSEGHRYVFIMRDMSGTEITRQQFDLRRGRPFIPSFR